VEWRTLTWSDVHLELQARDSYTEAQTVQIEDAIDRTISYWNEQSDDKGRVHYRGDIYLLNSSLLKIHIDFGSASQEIIQLLLQNLDKIADPNFLIRVVFRS
jgi:murein L,D-transpeptidase YcbB/YkuD